MSGLEQLIPPIAQWLGIEPATLLLLLGMLVSAANITSRLIPDDTPGWLGIVRKVAKVIGLYVSPRITSGVSLADVAKASVGVPAKPAVVESMQDAGVLPEDAPKLPPVSK